MIELTIEQIRGLVQLERDMESGKQPFVVHDGLKWAYPAEVLEECDCKPGQSVSGPLLIAIMMINLKFIQEKIEKQDVNFPFELEV